MSLRLVGCPVPAAERPLLGPNLLVSLSSGASVCKVDKPSATLADGLVTAGAGPPYVGLSLACSWFTDVCFAGI